MSPRPPPRLKMDCFSSQIWLPLLFLKSAFLPIQDENIFIPEKGEHWFVCECKTLNLNLIVFAFLDSDSDLLLHGKNHPKHGDNHVNFGLCLNALIQFYTDCARDVDLWILQELPEFQPLMQTERGAPLKACNLHLLSMCTR